MRLESIGLRATGELKETHHDAIDRHDICIFVVEIEQIDFMGQEVLVEAAFLGYYLSLLKILYGLQIGFSSEDCSLMFHR